MYCRDVHWWQPGLTRATAPVGACGDGSFPAPSPALPLQSIAPGLAGRTFSHFLRKAWFFYPWNTPKHGQNRGGYLEIKPGSNGHFLNRRLATATRPLPSSITSWNKGLKEVSVCFCFALGRGESELVQTVKTVILRPIHTKALLAFSGALH